MGSRFGAGAGAGAGFGAGAGPGTGAGAGLAQAPINGIAASNIIKQATASHIRDLFLSILYSFLFDLT
jgi:uncharacterized spore protein YtfJ